VRFRVWEGSARGALETLMLRTCLQEAADAIGRECGRWFGGFSTGQGFRVFRRESPYYRIPEANRPQRHTRDAYNTGLINNVPSVQIMHAGVV
jgi:hypothetical protein